MRRFAFTVITLGLLITPLKAPYADTIRIASWNIKDFGKSKAKNDSKMGTIAAVISKYDIIAIREISNLHELSDPGCPRNEDSCPNHENCDLLLNALTKHLSIYDEKDYGFLFSPQVKDERYLFIYDKNKIEVIESGELVVDEDDDPSMPVCSLDSEGLMVRQPFYATFKADDFDFTLMTVHTKPDRNMLELQALSVFYWRVQEIDPDQSDLILLDDLNADCDYISSSYQLDLMNPEYIWVIGSDADTTVRETTDCAYDRIIFTESTSEDFTGNVGINKFNDDLDLSLESALKISDHYPVWGEFFTDKDTDH